MEFHPHKCQVLHITSKQTPIKFLYNIHSQTLEDTKTAKYLGVTIQNDLNWNKNIDATTKKSQQHQSISIEKHKAVPRKDQGALLQNPGMADPGICQCHWGPVHRRQHT